MSNQAFKIRLRKGDTVMIRSGKYKNAKGKVIALHPKENKVTVENVNIAKKHQKPTKKYPQGGIIEITRPIHVSKVGILDPTAKKPSRIGYKLDNDGNKIRFFKTSSKEIKS